MTEDRSGTARWSQGRGYAPVGNAFSRPFRFINGAWNLGCVTSRQPISSYCGTSVSCPTGDTHKTPFNQSIGLSVVISPPSANSDTSPFHSPTSHRTLGRCGYLLLSNTLFLQFPSGIAMSQQPHLSFLSITSPISHTYTSMVSTTFRKADRCPPFLELS